MIKSSSRLIQCSLVVNNSLLKKYPKLKPLLHRLDSKINLKTMQELNYQVDDQLLEPNVVARSFWLNTIISKEVTTNG